MVTDQDLIVSWRSAADDLGIAVVSHHVVGDEVFPVHVPLFGRAAGTLPVWIDDKRSRHEADASNYFISMLSPDVYCPYDRATFIETLVDWGWFGEADLAPTWYKDEVAK